MHMVFMCVYMEMFMCCVCFVMFVCMGVWVCERMLLRGNYYEVLIFGFGIQ